MPFHPHDDDDDAFDSNGILKDGRTFKVPTRMLDGYQRDIPQHFNRPRRPFITDASGDSTFGLHRPGFRLAAGGHAGDRALRDASDEEVRSAYDRYNYDITNAWRHRDEDEADDAETEARAGAIRNALISRGHDPDDIEDYLDSCDYDDLLDRDLGEHISAFESNNNNNNDQVKRRRLDELYRQRDAELSQAWKHNK
jgi:hypothetical protein